MTFGTQFRELQRAKNLTHQIGEFPSNDLTAKRATLLSVENPMSCVS